MHDDDGSGRRWRLPPGPAWSGGVRPARSSKAVAAFVLGVAAVVTGPVIVGVLPAVLALVLAAEARRDAAGAAGHLAGAAFADAGRALGWAGVALAGVASLAWALRVLLGGGFTVDFPDTVQ